MKVRLVVFASWFQLVAGCASESNPAPSSDPMPAGTAPAQAGAGAAPIQAVTTAGTSATQPQSAAQSAAQPKQPFGPDAEIFEWHTEKFTLEAAQEKYLCFAKTLEEDVVVNGYKSDVEPFVHHLILNRARVPETEGFAECDVAFKNTWETLFISGAGDTTLEFPSDAGAQLKKGTQLVLQMHLLNLKDTRVEGAVAIDMRRSSVTSPRPVSSYIFGTAAVELPPKQKSEVVGTCSVRQPVHLIAGFPHMHLLGSSLRFEVGASSGAMKEVFKRDPFDFNEQRIDSLDVVLAPGDVSRVSCKYDNPTDQKVSYGESTKNEMCYFVGFAVDLPGQSACLEVLPPHIF